MSTKKQEPIIGPPIPGTTDAHSIEQYYHSDGVKYRWTGHLSSCLSSQEKTPVRATDIRSIRGVLFRVAAIHPSLRMQHWCLPWQQEVEPMTVDWKPIAPVNRPWIDKFKQTLFPL